MSGKRLLHSGAVVGAVNINYCFVITYAVFVTSEFFIFKFIEDYDDYHFQV